MKLIGTIFLIFMGFSGEMNVNTMRQLFSISSSDKVANDKLVMLTKDYELEQNPLGYAYHAGAVMSLANHVYWPVTKLNYFNKGKEKLEKAVNFDLKNVEIRFIRYSVQSAAPSILGYQSNLEEDKAYILENINTTNWSEGYKKEIKLFLKVQ